MKSESPVSIKKATIRFGFETNESDRSVTKVFRVRQSKEKAKEKKVKTYMIRRKARPEETIETGDKTKDSSRSIMKDMWKSFNYGNKKFESNLAYPREIITSAAVLPD